MTGMIYTNQRSKLTRKQREARAALRKEQREIRRSLEKDLASRELDSSNLRYVRSSPDLPSVDSGVGYGAKRESPKYTGDKMIGIGQLHKSNAVPVFKQEEAVELASMRR